MRKNLVGITFGNLVGVEGEEFKFYGKRKIVYQKVICKCSKVYFTRRDHLLGGRITNCGCEKVNRARKMGLKSKVHGMDGTKFCNIYRGIKSRCYYSGNDSFQHYGGRGIKMSNMWLESFENFKEDMYNNYLKHYKENNGNTSIDRIDVNGNYCKENCKWATYKEQARNRRNNKIYKVNGVNMLLCEINDKYGFKTTLVRDRIKRGWSIERIINTPVK